MLVRNRIALDFDFEGIFTTFDVLVTAALPRLTHGSEPVTLDLVGLSTRNGQCPEVQREFLLFGQVHSNSSRSGLIYIDLLRINHVLIIDRKVAKFAA